MRKKDGSKRRKKFKAVPVIIGVVIVLVIVIAVLGGKGGKMATVVTTTNAFKGELQESISTSGILEAEETKVYFAPVNGKIADILVVPGDAVKKGDLMIGYDEAELESTFRQATLQQSKLTASYNGTLSDDERNQAKLAEANKNLAVLEQQLADYKAYLKDLQEKLGQSQRETSNALAAESFQLNESARRLQEEIGEAKKPAVIAQKTKELQEVQSKIAQNNYVQQIAGSSDYEVKMQKEISDVQERIANCEEYKAKMESQKAGSEPGVMDDYAKTQFEADQELSSISFAEAEADYYIGKAGICADFDGIVTEVVAVEGSTVMEGTQLMKLESSGQVKVVFSASKWDLEKLAVGQKAEVTISGNVYAGFVSRIDRMASPTMSNTPMVGAEIHIDEPDDKIILGLDAKITVFTQHVENMLLMPVEAVNADKEGDFVYVVEDGIVVRKPVVCGISNDTYTVVLEGVTEADQIVLTSKGDLEEGAAVTVMP